jgi:hypothetical protein
MAQQDGCAAPPDFLQRFSEMDDHIAQFLRAQPPEAVEAIAKHLETLSTPEAADFMSRLVARTEIEYKPLSRDDVRPLKEEPRRFGLMPADTMPLRAIGKPK